MTYQPHQSEDVTLKVAAIAADRPKLTVHYPVPGGRVTTPEGRRKRMKAKEAKAKATELREKRAALVRHHTAKRRAAKLQRTPPWADMDAILTVYERARRLTHETGIEHHVDHEIPLQGKLVSGLHVHNNLQILTGSENSRKRNRYEVDA